LMRRLDKHIDKINGMKWERGGLNHFLRVDLQNASPDQEVKTKLEKLMALDITIAESIRAMIDEAATDLSVAQKAKLYLFAGDFEYEIKRLIERAQQISEERRRANGEDSKKKPTREDEKSGFSEANPGGTPKNTDHKN